MNSSSVQTRDESFLPLIETLAAVFAGASYGLGWLFTSGFASRFGIYPEEIGLTFTFIAVRTAFLVLGVTAVAGPALYIAWDSRAMRKFWESGSENVSTLFNGAFLAIQLVLIGTFVLLLFSWRPWKYGAPYSIVVTVAAGIAFVSFMIIQYLGCAKARYGSHPDDSSAGPWKSRRRILALLILLVIAIFLALTTWFSGVFVAARVKGGDPIDIKILHFNRIVIEVPGTSDPELGVAYSRDPCFMYLGSADGLAVLYETMSNRIFRVAVENLTHSQEIGRRSCPSK